MYPGLPLTGVAIGWIVTAGVSIVTAGIALTRLARKRT